MAMSGKRAWHGAALIILSAVLLLAAGCGIGPGPAQVQRQWAIIYPAPDPNPNIPLPASLLVKRFWAASGLDSVTMLIALTGPERSFYSNSDWLAPPSDMIGDLITRDFAARGDFLEVLSWRSLSRARYVLSGGVEMCRETQRGKGVAELRVSLLLQDTQAQALPQRVLLQKTYSVKEPIKDPGARGLAQSMGRAAAELSAQVRADVLEAIKGR